MLWFMYFAVCIFQVSSWNCYFLSYYLLRTFLAFIHCVVSFWVSVRMHSSFYKWICHLHNQCWIWLFILTWFSIGVLFSCQGCCSECFSMSSSISAFLSLDSWSLRYSLAVLGVTFTYLLFLVICYPVFVTPYLYDQLLRLQFLTAISCLSTSVSWWSASLFVLIGSWLITRIMPLIITMNNIIIMNNNVAGLSNPGPPMVWCYQHQSYICVSFSVETFPECLL